MVINQRGIFSKQNFTLAAWLTFRDVFVSDFALYLHIKSFLNVDVDESITLNLT